MAGRTAGPIKTKLGIGTHVDAGSVLGKVKVIWHHLANANKTPYRDNRSSTKRDTEARRAETIDRDNRSSAKRDKYGGQRPARAERIEARRAETTPSGGRVITV